MITTTTEIYIFVRDSKRKKRSMEKEKKKFNMLLVSFSSCFVSFGFFGGGGMTFEPMRDAQFHVNKKCVTQSKTGE
jgi:hypothetical protein